MTTGDRIRNMSNVELAKLFQVYDKWTHESGDMPFEEEFERWIEWLDDSFNINMCIDNIWEREKTKSEDEKETMPKTKEAAIDYLNEIGWLSEHDKELTNDWISGDEHNYPKEDEIVLARGINGKPYTARYLGHGMFFRLQPDSGSIVEWKRI